MDRFASVFLLVLFLFEVFPQAVSAAPRVVVYTSVDQVVAQPILALFEQRTGINVKAVYDVEAAKTVGLANRLLAEKKHPRADVFWNSEIARTIVLDRQGLFSSYFSPQRREIPARYKDPAGHWTGFACRARVIIYNPTLVRQQDLPRTLARLTDPAWRGRVAMAYPLLGTAATHVAAMYAALGPAETENFLRKLKANKVLVVAGNSVVRDVVAAGEVPLGLTDSDDVFVALEQGKPVALIYPDQQGAGTFLIPNTVALVRGGPHPAQGRKLIDFLLSREVEELLAAGSSHNMPVRKSQAGQAGTIFPPDLKVLDVDYSRVAQYLQRSDPFCRQLFAD